VFGVFQMLEAPRTPSRRVSLVDPNGNPVSRAKNLSLDSGTAQLQKEQLAVMMALHTLEECKNDPKALSGLARVYLAFYNLLQVFGWTYIFLLATMHFVRGNSYDTLYNSIHSPLKLFQSLAVFEIFHCILGLVRSPVMVTTQQVFSRLFLVWGICAGSSNAVQGDWAFAMMLTAWTITEIVRYLYYACNLYDVVPAVLIWCRYTFFFVLYPMGVSGELLTCWRALPELHESRVLSLTMPNRANMAIEYSYIVAFIMLLYLPGFPPLYLYMIEQRKKIMGRSKKTRLD